MQVAELHSEDELRRAYPLMHELRTHLSEEGYLELLGRMIPEGYRLFALHDEDGIRALAGIGLGTNLYYGRYLWVYDLVTTESARSRGHGAALMSYLETLARAEGCDTIALASGLQRSAAHRFYEERIGMQRASYTFSKALIT